MKIKVLGIMGKSASGKSTILNELRERGFYVPREITTRPPRAGEKESYRFVTEEMFAGIPLFCSCLFNKDWEYGIPAKEINENEVNIIGLNAQYYNCLKARKDIDLKIVYLAVSDDVLDKRQFARLKKRDFKQLKMALLRKAQDARDFACPLSRYEPDLVLDTSEMDNFAQNVDKIAELVKSM